MDFALKHPWGEYEFQVNLYSFLADFDALERGPGWNDALNQIDVNSDEELSRLVGERMLTGRLVEDYNTKHKWEVLCALIRPLSCKDYDFDAVISKESLDREGLALPTNWRIAESRRFFEVIYEAHYNAWLSELAEYCPPTPDELRTKK